MRGLRRLVNSGIYDFSRAPCTTKYAFYSSTFPEKKEANFDQGEFRKLDLIKKEVRPERRKREKKEVQPPRYKKMPTDQDWPSVWPVARTFHPASVPLPLHQGYITNKLWQHVPNKFANLELMKIPNFLHLTPPAITRHCEALKQFCTPWPEGLVEEKAIDDEFPVQIATSDYCHSSPTIRDHRARIVTLTFKLDVLKFDDHARDKFCRLVGDRYNYETGLVTIVTDCCPLRKQNLDYALYLLTALYHESWTSEPWENEKMEADMETYVWDSSYSKKRLQSILTEIVQNSNSIDYLKSAESDSLTAEKIALLKPVKKYSEAVESLHNNGETTDTVDEYAKSVRELFKLPVA